MELKQKLNNNKTKLTEDNWIGKNIKRKWEILNCLNDIMSIQLTSVSPIFNFSSSAIICINDWKNQMMVGSLLNDYYYQKLDSEVAGWDHSLYFHIIALTYVSGACYQLKSHLFQEFDALYKLAHIQLIGLKIPHLGEYIHAVSSHIL